MRSISSLVRFAQLPVTRKLLYGELCVRLVGAWALVRLAPYKHWRRHLSPHPDVKSLDALDPANLRFLADVQHAFRQIKWATRDRATCLMLVLVARWMLNRRRIPGVVFLGVRRDPKKPGLHAHAWMISAIGVVGHEEIDGLTIVERFGAT